MFPPAPLVAVSVKDLVVAGRSVQREFVTHEGLGRAAAERGLRTGSDARATWEAWDRDGVVCPLAFYVGIRETQHVEGDYPMPSARRDPSTGEWAEPGYLFRDQTAFRPWNEYEYTLDEHSQVQPLYSEWQLLSLPLVLDGDYMSVPVTVLAGSDESLLDWASQLRKVAQIHADGRQTMHGTWLPTLKILLRLQARYWPYVVGTGRVFYRRDAREGDRPTLDAVRFEYQAATAQETLSELGITTSDLLAIYEWMVARAEHVDPQQHLPMSSGWCHVGAPSRPEARAVRPWTSTTPAS